MRQYNALEIRTDNVNSEKNNQSGIHQVNCCKHLEKISELKSTTKKMEQENEKLKDAVHVAENQAKIFSDKYTKLKSKHIKLLDMLMEKETQIQNLKLIPVETSALGDAIIDE